MAVNGQKYYILSYKTTHEEWLKLFLDKAGDNTADELHWIRPVPNTYIIVTLRGSSWNIKNLTERIRDSVNGDIVFTLVEVANDYIDGYLPERLWKSINDSQYATETYMNASRMQKIRGITKRTRTTKKEKGKETT